jgi:hypothetical protein
MPINMNEEEWEYMSDIKSKPSEQDRSGSIGHCEMESILTPESSPELAASSPSQDFVIPTLTVDTTKKKFNLFDKYSYTQLIEYIVRTKVTSQESPKFQRGSLYRWFKDHINRENEQCNKFMLDNEKSLFRLRNKRQLLMFLSRKFSKIHTATNQSAAIAMTRGSSSRTCRILRLSFLIIASVLLALGGSYFMIFHTEVLERIFASDSQKVAFVKTIRSLALSLRD